MKKFPVLAILFFLLVWGPVPARAAERTVVAPDLIVNSVEFGIFQDKKPAGEEFLAFSHVPLRPGQKFGWKTVLQSSRARLRWREELDLPLPPAKWLKGRGDRVLRLTPGSRSIAGEWETPLGRDTVMSVWSVTDGDPPGDWVMRVFVEDVLIRTFTFRVE